MRKSNILHKYAKEKDFLIISLLFKHITVTQKHKTFSKMIQRMRNLPVFKAGKLNNQLFLAEFHLLHMIMLLLFKTAHLFVSPSRQTTLNSALQRALKHSNNACSTTRGSIPTWSIRRNNAVTIDDKVKFKKNQFSKQTGYTSNISISYDG